MGIMRNKKFNSKIKILEAVWNRDESVENLISNIEYKLENISQNAEEKNKRWK